MRASCYRFDAFLLDAEDRRLLRDGKPLEINSRYFDALAILVGEQGRLVSKDRFLAEAWRGVPVTDEALTQCIKTLRRLLGDDAARPRFIQTVPKHGYRFIALVESAAGLQPLRRPMSFDWARFAMTGAAGTVGGGIAGFIGGLVYGFAAASRPDGVSAALSILLVVQCLTIAAALMGGAGVSFAIAAVWDRGWRWSIAAGALGGLIVGGLVKLLGIDAFHLMFGAAPAGITGAGEGLVLGAGAGLGACLARRSAQLRIGLLAAVISGAVGGLVISLAGGRLMGGSLDVLASTFHGSHLRLDALGALAGERGFGPVTSLVTSALEGALFSSCVAAAMVLALRSARRELVSGGPAANA